jgi:hypothetical protein
LFESGFVSLLLQLWQSKEVIGLLHISPRPEWSWRPTCGESCASDGGSNILAMLIEVSGLLGASSKSPSWQ